MHETCNGGTIVREGSGEPPARRRCGVPRRGHSRDRQSAVGVRCGLRRWLSGPGVRIRACHLHGRFIAKNNQQPRFTIAQALENPLRDTDRIVLPPAAFAHEKEAAFAHEKEKVERRLPAAIKFITERRLNEFVPGDLGSVGIVVQGGIYNGVMRALQEVELADVWGHTRVPLYVMNVTYPLIDSELTSFCREKSSVLVVEEGQPDYIEQALHAVLRKSGIPTRIFGKDVLPMAGEYTAAVLAQGLRDFVCAAAPDILAAHVRLSTAPSILAHDEVKALAAVVPPRPPGFCTGCPKRPIFAAMKLVEKELGPRHVAADMAATCSRFCRRSILAPRQWATDWARRRLPPSASKQANVQLL